jgi:hypothetical protein
MPAAPKQEYKHLNQPVEDDGGDSDGDGDAAAGPAP